MMHCVRPSEQELHKKLEAAKKALSCQNGLFANPSKAVGELYELGIGDSSEVWVLLKELLEEITTKDYAGGKPPQKSYEKQISNQELFAFSWGSQKLGKEMYIKFALKDERFYYVSCHQNRSKT